CDTIKIGTTTPKLGECDIIKIGTIKPKPRSSPLPDLPIDFPDLKNLHLDLLENKDKLKYGLEPIPEKNIRIVDLRNQSPENQSISFKPKIIETTKHCEPSQHS